MAKAESTYYVLHGVDEFSRAQEVKTMRAQLGTGQEATLNIKVIDGKQGTVADVLSDARSFPFLSDKRLVLVYGLLTRLTQKGTGKEARAELDNLVAALPGLPEWARVVFIEEETLSSTHPVMKLMQTDSHGTKKEFPAPQPDGLTNWITRQAGNYNVTFAPRVAGRLAAMIGPDYRALDSEIDKLATYVGGKRPISDADVLLLTPDNTQVSIFALVDYMGERNIEGATATLQRLFDRQQDPFYVMSMIQRQFRLILQAKSFLAEGGQRQDLATALNVKGFVLQKLLDQAKQFKLETLEAIYRSLLETDWKIKTGQIEIVLALDLLVAGLASQE